VRSKNIPYIEGIDHIRAFASLMVVLHHGLWTFHRKWDPPGLVEDNWFTTTNPLFGIVIETHIVVTMFFVLSGFVFRLAGEGREIHYGKFLKNRALRVLPLYWGLIFFGMAVFPERVNVVGALASLTIFGNSLAALNLWPISVAFWTVAIELQFYLIFPFLNRIMNRDGRRPIIVLLLFVVALRLVGFFLTRSIRDLNYWHLPGRLDAFLMGMLVAGVVRRRKLLEIHPAWALAGLVALFGTTFALNRLGGYPVQAWWKALWPAVEAVVCTFFVVTYIAGSRVLPRWLGRALRGLGELSFSTYLVHFMLLQVMFDHDLLWDLRRFGWSAFHAALANTLLFLVPATLLLSAMAYFAIEAPFMRMRVRYVYRTADDPGGPSPPAADA